MNKMLLVGIFGMVLSGCATIRAQIDERAPYDADLVVIGGVGRLIQDAFTPHSVQTATMVPTGSLRDLEDKISLMTTDEK